MHVSARPTPGPGTYDLNTMVGKRSSPAWTLGSRHGGDVYGDRSEGHLDVLLTDEHDDIIVSRAQVTDHARKNYENKIRSEGWGIPKLRPCSATARRICHSMVEMEH